MIEKGKQVTQENMFKIGDFSKLSRVPVSALRYYADIGLLEPVQVDQFSGYRYYSLDQLPRLNRIIALKDLGLSLTQIATILHDSLSSDEIQGILRLREAELQQGIDEMQTRLLRVRNRLQHIQQQEQGLPEAEVIIKEIPAQSALSLRATIAKQDDVATMFMMSGEFIGKHKINITSPPFTIFHDGEFKEADLDVEAVFPTDKLIDSSFAIKADWQLSPRTLDAIPQVASIIHMGDYGRFAETYEIIGRWIEANDYVITGNVREIYLRPPLEEEAITEIQFPVEKDS